MTLSRELLYLKNHIDYYICDLLDKVIEDSEDDPDYSAVTLCNLIYCYQKVFNPKKGNDAHEQIKEFILNANYTIGDFDKVISKFKIESEYYRGAQLVSFADNDSEP